MVEALENIPPGPRPNPRYFFWSGNGKAYASCGRGDSSVHRRACKEASGAGITQTVRAGLELVAASRAYAQLLQLRGKVHFSRTLADLKDDKGDR